MTTTTTNEGRAPRTFAQVAMSKALSSVASVEESNLKATIALASIMAVRQIEEIIGGAAVDEKRNKTAFRGFLKQRAASGRMVWTGTQHNIDAIRAAKGEKRTDLVKEYIDKKPKGATFVDGIKHVRTWSFRLMDHLCLNHAGEVHNLKALQDAGADGVAVYEAFAAFVEGEYGDTWSKFTETLAPAPGKKDERTKVQKLVDSAKELTSDDLATLVKLLQAELSVKVADEEAGADAADEGADEGADETPAETPDATPLAA